LKPGEGFVEIRTDVEIGLVIPKTDIVTGMVFFDQIVLKNQGFLFRLRQDKLDIVDSGNKKGDHGAGIRAAEVSMSPAFEILCLPHIEDLAGGILHEINTGRPWRYVYTTFQLSPVHKSSDGVPDRFRF
jgi:hypothetical protein